MKLVKLLFLLVLSYNHSCILSGLPHMRQSFFHSLWFLSYVSFITIFSRILIYSPLNYVRILYIIEENFLREVISWFFITLLNNKFFRNWILT